MAHESAPFAVYRRMYSESQSVLMGCFPTLAEAHEKAAAMEESGKRDWIVIRDLNNWQTVGEYGSARNR